MGPHRQAGSGRREFGRVALSSLAANARAEVVAHKARGQRLRALRALRRLEELERALDELERGVSSLSAPWYTTWGALAVTGVVWLASLAALGVAVAARGPSGVLVGAADVVMLVATVAWFMVAVTRRSRRAGGEPPPPNEGSSPAEADR
ncbi:MAG: hypothetical protein ACXVRJ_02855 [Gaiellaceae bacterium]